MEDSCPATPLLLTGRNSKSPLQEALSSPEPDGMKSPSVDSPDSRCVICLGRLQNKSFTDSCLHQFCFQCLLQWSKIKAECPLCKQPFKSIIHNVRSNLDYDQYHVEHGEPRLVLTEFMHSYNFDLVPTDRRFRYRSTMTREYFRELAESFLVHTRRLPDDPYQISPLVPVNPVRTPNVRRSNRLHAGSSQQRTRLRGTSDFRRNIYAQDLWVQDLVDISGRYRECTPQFYRENPAQIHRIIPWLNREVNVLLSDCESHAAYVLSQIVSLLTQHPIRSREFREHIQSYFGERTDHFIHELYIFARSVYDIAGFDENAVYGTNPNYATEVQEISSSSDNDSDIEIIETIKSEDKPKKSRQGLKKLLLKRAGNAELKSDEPVAGPSGITSSKACDSIEICESDPEEIKILDYVKPEPEIVTLSSGEEEPTFTDLDIFNGEYAEVIQSDINQLRQFPSQENDKKKNRSTSAKGKCKSNGFGLKGNQKRKYMKSRCSSISSTSSRSSTNSNSSSSSTSTSTTTTATTTTTTTSSSTSSSDSSNSSSSSGGGDDSGSTSNSSLCKRKRYKSDSSASSKSSHKYFIKSRKKKSKTYQKKFKKKIVHKSGHKTLRSSSDVSKTKRKRVKSCVIVPNCDSSPSLQNGPSRSSKEPEYLKSYWSIALNDRRQKWVDLSEKKSKRKHRDRSKGDEVKKRNRDTSSSSERTVGVRNENKKKTNTFSCKTTTNYDTVSSRPGDLSYSYGIPSSSSSLNSLPSKFRFQSYANSN